ncbi:MAG: AsmA-like C-terminal region-containing protein, partial [Acidobacteriaceae bacterium]
EWRGAPLGQVTRMFVAHDLGWRGDTSLTAHITGVPTALGFQLSAGASDFHRESFETAHPLSLHVTCSATYRHAVGSIDGIHCISPVGNGGVALSGTMQQIHTPEPQPDLKLIARHVPADAVLELLRHTRGRLNSDITLSGTIEGELTYARQPLPVTPRIVDGGYQTIAGGALLASNLLVRGDGMEQLLPDLRFTVQSSAPSPAPPRTQPSQARLPQTRPLPIQPSPQASQALALVLEPATIDLGGPEPLVANARLTRLGYQLHYGGSALLGHLLPLAHAFNIVPAAFQGLQGNGTADYNLTVQGDWLLPAMVDPAAPLSALNGAVGLHNADFQPSYLAEPIHIATATATISPAELRWNGVAATLGTTQFTGNIRIPLPCTAACERKFDLTAETVSFGALSASLRGEDEGVVRGLISRVRSRSQDWPLLDGIVQIAHLDLGQIEIANTSADVTLRDDNLEVRSLDGHTLGGTLHATGAVELASSPSFDANVQLRHASAPELAQLLKEHWGPGTIDLSADLALSGSKASDLSSSAKGTLRWSWAGGALPQLTATLLRRFDRWSGHGKVAKGAIAITSSEVSSGSAVAAVTGTIGSDRSLDLKVASPAKDPRQTETAAASTISMSGTLMAPVVETQ